MAKKLKKDKYDHARQEAPASQSADDLKDQALDQQSELDAQLRRLAADYDNYRRRTEAERAELAVTISIRTLLDFAPVLDNCRRAAAHLPAELANNNWATGMLYIAKQVEQIFEQYGLERIETVGQQFDPRLHEAIEKVTDSQVPVDQIIEEVESGYRLRASQKVVKPARVKVSAGPPQK